jgi:putative transposase
MKNDNQQQRIWAVRRFLKGEKPELICASLKRCKSWLYKWVKRHIHGGERWSQSRSRRPLTTPVHTFAEIEEIIKMLRLSLYNRNVFCGAQAIRWEMEDLGVKPLPSIRTINRILSRHGLTHRRTGIYVAKGKPIRSCPRYRPIKAIRRTGLAHAI